MRTTSLALVAGLAAAQKIGTVTPEYHLKMPIKHCTKENGCVQEDTTIVLDGNWRWLHKAGCEPKCTAADNCYTGSNWNWTQCPDVKTCTDMCALDGVSTAIWNETYGVVADGKGAIDMTFVKNGTHGTNVGSRVYLLEDEDTYKQFNLLNKEFTFTVDAGALPCGLNGALYFVEMESDGGKAKYASNTAGAKFGTGYCDAQCPHDLKWIEGEANLIGWNGSKTDPNAGTGKYGTCCAELDIWEANKISTQMTVHSCNMSGAYKCTNPIECGDNAGGYRFDGVCDKNGCDFNPYRVGDESFYGPGSTYKIDSTKPVTVVTQFITDTNTEDGTLIEMKRFYVQGEKTIYNPTPTYGNYTSISEDMCKAQMAEFDDRYDVFSKMGGVKAMGEAMKRKMVLTLSMWDDHEVGMIWLDAVDPCSDKSTKGMCPAPYKKGAKRGTCTQGSGAADVVEKNSPGAHVIYSDIRYGELNTTFLPSPPSPPTPAPSSCPGGSLSACMALCPATPPAVYKICVADCASRCAGVVVEAEDDEVEAQQVGESPLTKNIKYLKDIKK